MNDISLLLYPALVIFLLFFRCKIFKQGEYNKDFLSQSQTKMIQVFACLGVILHHVTQGITSYGSVNRGPITILSSMGILFTSVFFFCSGYGLFISYETKPDYLKHFLLNRLSAVLVPFFTANILYVLIITLRNGVHLSVQKKLSYIFGLTLINSNGWFIVEIVVLYLAFYIFFKLIRNKNIALTLLCAFTFGLIFYSKSLGHNTDTSMPNSSWFQGEWWFNSTITFVLGLVIARFKKTVTAIFNRFYKIIVIFVPIFFIIVFIIEERILDQHGYYRISMSINNISDSTLTLIWQMALCVMFILLLITISHKISFSNKGLKFLNSLCTELFLVHNMFVNEFSKGLSISGHSRYLIALIPSILLAFVMSRLDNVIIKIIKNCIIEIETLLSELNIKPLIRTTKRFFILAVVAVAIFILYWTAVNMRLFAGREYNEEIETLRNSKVGDTVVFGRFDTDEALGKERLEWIVLSIDNNRYTLITKHGIAGSTYNKAHSPITWAESDIHATLNSHEYLSIFSKKEKAIIVENACGDIISLLTAEEANTYFNSNESRILTSTAIAKRDNVNVNNLSKINYWDYKHDKSSWWWLRGTNSDPSLIAPIVSCGGEVLSDKKTVNKPNGAIRPVIIINLPD